MFCGAVPHAGLGIALKCDDGAGRASEAAFAAVLAGLDVWTPEEKTALSSFAHATLKNWRKIEVGGSEGGGVSTSLVNFSWQGLTLQVIPDGGLGGRPWRDCMFVVTAEGRGDRR